MSTPEPPDQIGPYRVIRPIARGGMAEVYEVADPHSGEHLALKLLMQTGSALPRFNREYEALTRLNHPGIVRVYQYGFHEGAPWLTMELLDGVVLQNRVKGMGRPNDPVRIAEVLRVGYLVSDALHYVHERGLVHRDLKSANVLVLPDGRVKLLDFGTAHLHDPLEVITRDGEFVGTFGYASPEQLTGGRVDWRSDLYSLGVLLFRLATGKMPFEAEEPHEIARLHVKVQAPGARALVPELPEALEALILRLLEKSPEQRLASAAEVARTLQEIAGRPLDVLPGRGLAVRTERPVARDVETRTTRAALRRGRPGAAVLAIGGDGSGLPLFLNAVADSLKVDGWRPVLLTLRRGKALRSLAEGLRNLAAGAGADRAVAVLKGLVRAGELRDPEQRKALQSAAFDAVIAYQRAGAGPVLLVFHPLQHLGPVGLEVIAGLRRAIEQAEAPILFLGGGDEALLDAQAPARRRWSEATVVTLEPLPPREVALAVSAMLHRRPPPAELARRLYAASGGQPEFLAEVVAGLVEGGALAVHAKDGNRLAWSGGQIDDLPIAESAKEAFQRALREVPAGHRGLLDALALAEDPLPVEVLARTLGCAPAAASLMLDRLEHTGWVLSDLDGNATLARALAAPLLRAALTPMRRAALERALCVALRGQAGSADFVQLLLATGHIEEGVRTALTVARRLVAEGRPARALDVLDLASPLAADLDEDALRDELADLHLLHTQCMMALRPTDLGTARALMRAHALAQDPARRARVDVTRARMQWIIGHYPNFRKFLMTAWQGLPDTGFEVLAAEIARHLAQSFVWSGQIRAAGAWVQAAQDTAARSEDPVAIGESALTEASWRLSIGETSASVILAASVLDSAPEGPLRFAALAAWASALRLQGRYSEALTRLYAELPRSRTAQPASQYVDLLLATAWIEVDLARLGRAQECLDELDATLHKGEYLHLRLEAGLMRGRTLLASGQLAEAERSLQEVLDRARQAQLGVLTERARALLGETYAAQGNKEAATEALNGAVVGLIGTGDLAALREAVFARAHVLAAEIPTATLFEPIAADLEREPSPVADLERVTAEARYEAAKGDPGTAKALFRKATLALGAIAKLLDESDRAALRVHPWARALRGGLR